jgi:hypothetical protein
MGKSGSEVAGVSENSGLIYTRTVSSKCSDWGRHRGGPSDRSKFSSYGKMVVRWTESLALGSTVSRKKVGLVRAEMKRTARWRRRACWRAYEGGGLEACVHRACGRYNTRPDSRSSDVTGLRWQALALTCVLERRGGNVLGE